MAYGDRKHGRVDFERGIDVFIMGIDGTWRRDCVMFDVSQTGACLRIEGSYDGLDLKEFFLLLSSTGLAFRRCRMVRVAGDQIGVAFLERDKPKKKPAKPPSCEATAGNDPLEMNKAPAKMLARTIG
jgi:PilZ domain